MSVTVQQLLSDAKRLVTRLRDHDNSAETLISQAQTLNNNVETMKQYHEEVEKLNALAHQRPRSALILNIQQENRHIRELQQENRELRAMLEEHQSVLELIMNKYRQQVKSITETTHAEKMWAQKDFSVEFQKRSEKIAEMSAVMKRAVEIDDENYSKEQKLISRLLSENQLIRDVLELNQVRSALAQKSVYRRTDEEREKIVCPSQGQTACGKELADLPIFAADVVIIWAEILEEGSRIFSLGHPSGKTRAPPYFEELTSPSTGRDVLKPPGGRSCGPLRPPFRRRYERLIQDTHTVPHGCHRPPHLDCIDVDSKSVHSSNINVTSRSVYDRTLKSAIACCH